MIQEGTYYFGNYDKSTPNSISIERNGGSSGGNGSSRFYFQNSPDVILPEAKTNNTKVSSLTFAFNKNLGVLNVYMDGIKVKSNVVYEAFKKILVGKRYYIGRDARTGETAFNGEFMSVRIYERVLTSNEIYTNYHIDKARFGL